MKRVYSKIESIIGNVITVVAQGVKYGELAIVKSKDTSSLAEVIKLDKDKVSLQVYNGTMGISTSDEVKFLGHPMQITFSENLLGRIFDGAGNPKDGGPRLEDDLIEIGGPSANPAKRIV
ncbi:hypothetical protein KZ870_38760, partial [Pseudomonas aeruginosa]|nr:hypothetical protein [Pseudomonas aeruginosa]